tara:strand:+ start:311 stop:544 length:234 start_codon:yes stop_codon:yes gene_type:complete
MKKIPKRYYRIVMTATMALFMSFLMSGVVLLMNIGFTDDFFMRWMKAFISVYLIALIASFIATPIVTKFAQMVTEPE